MLAKMRKLASFPRMRRVVPEIGDASMREVMHRDYRIVYHVDEEDIAVDVLTIFHSSRPLGLPGDRR
jgi:plasmid stabilization system protein ParE